MCHKGNPANQLSECVRENEHCVFFFWFLLHLFVTNSLSCRLPYVCWAHSQSQHYNLYMKVAIMMTPMPPPILVGQLNARYYHCAVGIWYAFYNFRFFSSFRCDQNYNHPFYFILFFSRIFQKVFFIFILWLLRIYVRLYKCSNIHSPTLHFPSHCQQPIIRFEIVSVPMR